MAGTNLRLCVNAGVFGFDRCAGHLPVDKDFQRSRFWRNADSSRMESNAEALRIPRRVLPQSREVRAQ
jgi:hypothetical protein